ncbi:protein FANTASTIC FOUR 1-like [Humulus lupulus]|uniref:protein FANTASTIC FOUR 1-like n=1 Tax=Humulus lupulus TaxID=3486 RepID=UPI002B40F7AE|nr:protein FANTASTIC FOUR 1-like [Humulus lupulus]
MSTSVCQGLQSCLEPALAEPKVLRLKLALPKSNLAPSSPPVPKPNNPEPKQTDGNDNKNVGANGGWNFLQVLSNTKNDTKTDDKVYVHPMVKRSSAMLTAKSLEMCTEGLGSETGSDSGDSSGDEMSLLSSSSSPLSSVKGKKSVGTQAAKRYRNWSSSFPPPLTSVSGSSGFQVRPHREDGRLVLRAVIVPSTRSFFHAERTDGRLTLRLMSSEPVEEEKEVEEEEEAAAEEDIDEVETETEIEGEEENIDEDSITNVSFWSGDMDDNNENNNAEDEMVNGKLRRPISRCKEDGRGERVLMNWEAPFLVAS